MSGQLDRSLDRLQTDQVDVYFLHRDNVDIPVGEFVSALNDEAVRGRIKAFGGSNWTLERVKAANAYAAEQGLQPFTALSNQFSLARMVEPIWPGVEAASDSGFREFLAASNIALFPWSSQARGFFTPWADPIIADRGAENRAVTTMQPTIAELKRTWFAEDNFERRARAGAPGHLQSAEGTGHPHRLGRRYEHRRDHGRGGVPGLDLGQGHSPAV